MGTLRHLLSDENREPLSRLAEAKALLAFDFDGTLAPIVSNREAAWMRAETEHLLTSVCQLYPCAVISGRSQADVFVRIGSAGVKYVVGNHGLEPGLGLEEFALEVAGARSSLERSLAPYCGVEIEDKRYSLAVHYRNSPQKRQARAAIRKAIATLPVRMRSVPGKLVLNVIPERGPDKGEALLSLMRVEQAEAVLYVGDDVTDEDAFRIRPPGTLLALRVGESKSSAAPYFVREQKEVDRLLETLISLRQVR